MRAWLAGVALLVATGCKGDCRMEKPCAVDGGGEYYVLEPDDPTGVAFVFLHGAKRDHFEILEKIDEDLFLDAGIRLVLPDSDDGKWAVSRGTQAAQDEAAFLATVADMVRADGLADGGVALGGHSVGSSMTWFTACFEPDAFDVYNATSGGFWAPVPTTCEAPVALRHTHGTNDQLVPLEGRPVNGGAEQADVLEGMALWAATNGCDPEPVVREDDEHTCTVYQGCAEPLEICLHDGGHGLRPDWNKRALDWFDQAM